MSYCRWSSDNWRSDVYCYESEDGYYVTEVAHRRHIGEIPVLADTDDVEAFGKSYVAQLEALRKCQLVSIGGPYDGRRFEDDTLGEFLGRLEMLRDAGYHIPSYVFDDVRAEMVEAVTTEKKEKDA